jgi:hypothetical protein
MTNLRYNPRCHSRVSGVLFFLSNCRSSGAPLRDCDKTLGKPRWAAVWLPVCRRSDVRSVGKIRRLTSSAVTRTARTVGSIGVRLVAATTCIGTTPNTQTGCGPVTRSGIGRIRIGFGAISAIATSLIPARCCRKKNGKNTDGRLVKGSAYGLTAILNYLPANVSGGGNTVASGEPRIQTRTRHPSFAPAQTILRCTELRKRIAGRWKSLPLAGFHARIGKNSSRRIWGAVSTAGNPLTQWTTLSPLWPEEPTSQTISCLPVGNAMPPSTLALC